MTTSDYAQHFTPLCAVDLVYDLVGELYRLPPAPRLIDPACGEGAFLLRAIERGLTSGERTVGVERDPGLACTGLARPSRPRTAVADALTGLAAPAQPGTFDLVVANPPYGAGSAGLREIDLRGAVRLIQAYGLWAIPERARGGLRPERLRSYPAELLFLELCVALARPGGHVAILLPEGTAANARYACVRRWVLANLQLDAVVGLPRGTFRHSGAAAKTVLMLLTKRRPGRGHKVLLGEVGEWREDGARGRAALEFANERPQASPDLTRRLDPGYWHPHLAGVLDACPLPLASLDDFIADLTYGPIVTGRERPGTGERGPVTADGVAIVNQGQVGFCGVDLTAAPRVPEDSPWVSPRSLLRRGDVVLPRSGEGSLGKHRVAVYLGEAPAGVGSFVDLIRLRGLNPFYLAAFLKSRLGRAQVSRAANGVGVPNISFDEIRDLRIPALSPADQRTIERRYRRGVLPLHRQAVVRHATVRWNAGDPRQDAELRRLREAGERRWQRVISELDRQMAPP